jgi:hypothetical protein
MATTRVLDPIRIRQGVRVSQTLYLIAKAERKAKDEYRPSVFNKLPGKRKKDLDVHYRRGTALKRTGRTIGYSGGGELAGNLGGSAAGGGIGALVGRATGKGRGAGATVGSGIGAIVGGATGGFAGMHHADRRDIESGDVKYIGRGKDSGKRLKSVSAWTGKRTWE